MASKQNWKRFQVNKDKRNFARYLPKRGILTQQRLGFNINKPWPRSNRKGPGKPPTGKRLEALEAPFKEKKDG